MNKSHRVIPVFKLRVKSSFVIVFLSLFNFLCIFVVEFKKIPNLNFLNAGLKGRFNRGRHINSHEHVA